MEIPEFMTYTGFWIKFIPLFLLFVVVPVFFLNFTGDMGIVTKMLFLVAGAVGLAFALNGKTLNLHRRSQ